MKLLMLTGLGSAMNLASGKRGAFYYTLEEFSRHWERIDIIVPAGKPSAISSQLSEGVGTDHNIFGNVYIHVLECALVLYPFFFIKKALNIYREYKFDLMTAHEFPPFYNGIAAGIINYLTGAPYILEIHHIPGYPRAGSFKEAVYRWAMKIFIRLDSIRARAVRVVNNKETAEFLIRAGVPVSKIKYIPSLYIDMEVFRPLNTVKLYDLIFVGRLEKNKGIGLFMDLVKKTNYNAIIVGDGSLKRYVESTISNLGSRVVFHGWAKDSREVAELIGKSKLLVMPSYNEGGPRVVVEALACGVPILATPIGIVPDLFGEKPVGKIVSWSPEAMALKAKELLSDVKLYEECKKNGIELAGRFERKKMIANYAEELKSLAAGERT